jgi:hypothetical protein
VSRVRRGLTWALTLPVVLGGTELAHALAYRLVYPQLHERVLLATGHAYLAWLPLLLGIAGALALAALVAAGADAARGRSPRELPAWAFAAVPPLAFLLQELLELSLHTGTFGWRAVLAPTFVPGLALQLPVAALSYLVARLLLRTAERLGRALAELHAAPSDEPPRLASIFRAPAGSPSSAGRTSRGPPRLVAV